MIRNFLKYVSLNIAGMLGISVYILADTFFIARSAGADGITFLNLVLPVYGLIYAIGAMIGIGSAIRYSIDRETDDRKYEGYFLNGAFFIIAVGLVFTIIGNIMPEAVIKVMGGDSYIADLGRGYTRTFMTFSCFFMLNYLILAFIRNDGAPKIASIATVTSSIFNIIFDYIFIFPMKMGIAGAALATGLAPVLSICICLIYLMSDKSSLIIKWTRPSFKTLLASMRLGVSSFIGEISSAITTTVYNYTILSIAGNTGLAAYGIIANFSLVAMSLFNGTAQGAQPLISSQYGKGEYKNARKYFVYSIVCALIFSIMILGLIFVFADIFVDIYNRDSDILLKNYAVPGMKVYFTGFLAAGINIVSCGYLTATDKAVQAGVASVLRGAVLIVIVTVTMAFAFGLNGVWASFAVTELLTLLYIIFTHMRKDYSDELTS